MSQVGLERRLWEPAGSPPIRQVEASLDSGHGAGEITLPVFAQLGRLDRRDDPGPTRPARDGIPRLDSVVDPPEASQQMGTIDRDAILVPRPAERLATIPPGRPATRLGATAEVGAPAGRPPGFLDDA